MSGSEPRLELQALTKRFGHLRALRGVDLAVKRGECVALLGPNGAGKSTLLRIVAGLMKPTSGRVLLDGKPASSSAAELRARLGLVGHHTMLYDALSVAENLRFYGRLHEVPQLATRIDQLLRGLGLSDRSSQPVGTLSRGLQQRVAVARALLHDPDLLLLDEPHSGLDESASRVLATLLETVRRRGRTVLLVTHELNRALSLADRIVVLRDGRVAMDRPRSEVETDGFTDLYLRCLKGEDLVGPAPAVAGAAS